MRYGVVINPSMAPQVSAAGFDYLELRVTEAANPLSLDAETFSQRVQYLRQQTLRAECFCVLYPADFRLVGPSVDEERFRSYVEVALPRIKELGAEIVVWGSGDSRTIPEGFPRAEAWRQLKDRVAYVADICQPLGIRIALESLRRDQTNMLTTMGECLDLADELNRDVVGVVADIDHLGREEPDLHAAILRAGSRVIHAHLRDSNGRTPGTGIYDFPRFAGMLRAVGYNGRVSIEVRQITDAELVPMRAFLSALFLGQACVKSA